MRPTPAGERPATPEGQRAFTWPPVSYWMKVAAGVLVILVIAEALAVLSDILVLVLVSLVLAMGLQPSVEWLERRGVRRGLAVAVIYLTGLLVVGGFLALVFPVIIRELGALVKVAPDYLERAQRGNGVLAQLDERFDLMQKLRDLGQNVPSTALAFVRSLTTAVFKTLTVAILTAYFATALPSLRLGVARLLRREDRKDFLSILAESTDRVGGYVIGNLVVSLIAGVVSFTALAIIGVPYAAALAFWVALTDLIPTVGAILGALAAVAVAAFAGIPTLVATVLFFAVYQQIENYVIAPRVMRKAVDMSTGAVIVAVLVGGTLLGFVGALLALPLAAILKIAVTHLYLRDRLETVHAADAHAADLDARPLAEGPPDSSGKEDGGQR